MRNAIVDHRREVEPLAEAAEEEPVRALDELRRHYGLRGEADVGAFLVRHPDVVDLLTETRGRIGEYFGADPVDLETFVDPEAPAASELYALVRTRLGSADALRQLRRFDEAWWLDALDRTRAPVVVSIEHV